MELQERINTFSKLGAVLSDYIAGTVSKENKDKIEQAIKTAEIQNPWFTKNNIHLSIKNIAQQLEQENLNLWTKKYLEKGSKTVSKNIGVVSAGNIPLVGFHDFLSVLISGNKITLKLSSKDRILTELITDILQNINNDFNQLIQITEGTLENFDAIIATGSDNTSRYFEYYFGKYPNIIRKNRNSIAVLDGHETEDELKKLADDIYYYFGLGCRNISKVYLPEGYDITKMLDAFNHYDDLRNHNKFANNYTYNRSIYLMNSVKHYDNGFSLFKQDEGFSSPIAVIYFDYYKNSHNLSKQLKEKELMIQCIVSNSDSFKDAIGFGETQKPNLWDYADNIDTLKFLLSLN